MVTKRKSEAGSRSKTKSKGPAKAKTIDEYLAVLGEEQRAALAALAAWAFRLARGTGAAC